MKIMNELQIQQVSGAGFMADNGWSDFGDLMRWAYLNNYGSLDLLAFRPVDGSKSDVKDSYLEWCNKNNVDAVASAKLNGWAL